VVHTWRLAKAVAGAANSESRPGNRERCVGRKRGEKWKDQR
jgi:hypothetical protein